jgi:U2-associated protein SR140
LTQFTSGALRKTRREKEQEAADAKKKEEEASAAQAYAEFLNAFEGEDVSRRKTGSGFVRADSKTAYIPSMPAADRAKLRVCRICRSDRDSRNYTCRIQLSLSPPAAPKPKGKRAMDTFLEEIKRFAVDAFHSVHPPYTYFLREQAEREAKYARHGVVHCSIVFLCT